MRAIMNARDALLHPPGHEEHDNFNFTKRSLLGPQEFENDAWAFMENKLMSATFIAHGQPSSGPFSGNSPAVLEGNLVMNG
ncbi:hypothetical protein HYFRA_00012956 [Hymenoscyphus fraxineus]|uniref:Uncharacterized protein n=1 Tax=Hymenoscyphus fraxineus TaxID=746836 RepID=A0A9N9L4J1_9HELO|nr:hypothetical protein HYFRA_00012956 [Hymenoscyphus fraxineus]